MRANCGSRRTTVKDRQTHPANPAGKGHDSLLPFTHNEAVMSAITTVEKAVAGLEEEKPTLCMVVVGRYPKNTQPLPFSQKLFLS